MKLRAFLAALLFVALGCSGFRCDGQTRPAELRENKPVPDLRLVILTDPKGYLEPCGCQMRPLGGVDRLATTLARLRAEKAPVMLLAVGDLAFGGALRPEDSEDARQQETWRAETLMDIWSNLQLAAATPGATDLSQPEALLSSLIERGKFPWLLDNAAEAAASPLQSARVIEVGGVRVGVMGLIAPTPELKSAFGQALKPELAEVAQKVSAQLREQGANLVVALVTGDRRAAREVASHGADVVALGGIAQEKPFAPMVVGDGLVVSAGYQGQRVVTLDLKLNAQGPWHDASEWTLREERKDLEERIRELKAKVDAWSKDANIKPAELDAQRARLKQLEAELAQSAQPSFVGRWFSAEVTELSPDVPKQAETEAVIKAYDKRVNDYNRENLKDVKPQPVAEGQPHYVGADACNSCHSEAYTWWRSTKHGRAYKTLEDVNKQFNLSCVGCHVTGYNEPGGSTVTHVDLLKDVGCETCHGPGSQHVASPTKPGLVARDTPEAICVGCHNHEHSTRFTYDAFKPMLLAPGHGLPSKSAQ